MTAIEGRDTKRRNRNYEETHQLLILKAQEIIAARGVNAMSMAALARATGVNRTTIYYHFDSRDDLMAELQRSSVKKPGIHSEVSCWMGIDQICSSVAGDPEFLQAWMDNYIAAGDFRAQHPRWNSFVSQIARAFAELAPHESGDAEILCELLLTGAVNVSRKFIKAVHPQETLAHILARVFAKTALPPPTEECRGL